MLLIKKEIFLVAIILYSATVFCQTPSKLILVKENNKKVFTLKEGKRVKVITFNNGNKTKYKGDLTIVNEKCISIESTIIGIDSIYKVGSLSLAKQITGQVVAVTGVGIGLLGVHVIYEIDNLNTLVMALLYSAVGGTMILVSPFIIAGGELIAFGGMRKVKKNRKLIIQKGSD